MKKKILALLLALCMVIGMLPATAMAANTFTASNSWSDGLFTDVKQGDWFYENVKGAYELGLMVGCGDGTFEPYGRITLAQTVAVAARLHAVSTTGKDEFVQGDTWYRVYVDYALANGILDEELADYNQEATRLEFAHILVRALPAEDLQAINDVKYGEIPDVASDEAVYTLYRAGILNGKGNGQFGADDIIDRCQMAAIVTRMALPELRVKVEKESGIPSTGGNLWWPDFDWGNDDEVQPSPSPAPEEDVKVTVSVESENGAVKNEVSMESDSGVKATVPAGVTLTEGAKELTLTVDAMESTGSDVTAGEDEEMTSYDVHIEGVAEDNTVVITVALGAVLPKGLNMGNVELYHVEDGATNAMQQVLTLSELDAHNEFYYDPATGEVTVAMVSFSEVTVVAGESKWNGNFDYSWYTNAVAPLADEGAPDYIIANADQLAAFGAIVGGMDDQTQDSFSGKTVKLIADVNLGDKESENNSNLIFYPIGYWNNEGTYEKLPADQRVNAVSSGFYAFEGTFDGNGHTISNFYQNTWEMKGDHNWYDPIKEQYYRDGMGLFGKVYGGTVKNLTVENFSSDGEITTTGVIAAYADGATFENIAIFDCNPRVYNIGNGGIVGCVGWYAKEAGLKTTFKNITVDNSNKISALWGSYDVACGGIVGQYYPTSGQTSAGTPKNAGIEFVNCHVAAQMDVYNDVCANYQYYAYRYTGMLIGSVRENETIDGHVYPKMDGITASGCTVHFGTWNDYYYCEIIDNTTASYTHDYQMSRLTQVDSVDVTAKTYTVTVNNEQVTKDIPTSGRVNYVVVNGDHATENATCYHFKDGAVWEHEDGGYHDGTDGGKIIDENGDGNPDLREDKQHIYLEFNNLVTGYGWGVTTKGVGDLAGVTILDRQEGDSYVKFAKADSAKDSYLRGTTVTIGELFKAADISDPKLSIVSDKVQVFVSPVGDDSNVSGTYTANTTDWEKGTLTFYGSGAATVTITDYYYCTETTISITVTDPGFLYRVGNQNSVTYEQLSKLLTGKESSNVTINKETVVGTVSWSGSQFTGTGVVGVTVDGKEYFVEVVDATNVRSKTDATTKNIVLLNDISGGFTVSNGFAVYGNGFKAICSGDGSYRSASLSYAYVYVKDGGVLDNVQVICDVFPESYLFTSEMKANDESRYPYGNSAVIISGNSTISNCYIYGARNNILVTGGNVTIENTVTESGSFANIHINGSVSDTVTLRDVTTIQYETTSAYDTSKVVLGFGVVVGINESEFNAKLVLEGDLKQYNWVTSDNQDVSNSYAQSAIESALSATDYQHKINGATAVNLGIAYLNTKTATTEDSRANSDTIPYKLDSITMKIKGNDVTGQVYSVYNDGNTNKSLADRYDAKQDGIIPYMPTANKTIAPEIVFADTNESIILEHSFDSVNQKWIDKLKVDLDTIDGSSYAFSFSNLKVQKYGQDLAFTVKDADGNVVETTDTVTLSSLVTHEYTIFATCEEVEFALPFALVANRTSIPKPTIAYDSETFTNTTNGRLRLADTKNGDWRPTVNALAGVTITYWSTSQNKELSVDLGKLDLSANSGTINANVWTYTCDDYTLTLTGGEIKTGYNITPIVSAAVDSTAKLYYCSTNVAYGSTSANDNRTIKIDYVLTANGETATCERSETVNFSGLTVYDYSKFKSGTLEEAGSCVTPDTLVTLADGTQKRVDELTYTDEILAWNLFKGQYEVTSASYIVRHDEANLRITTLNFSDGTFVRIAGDHGFYNVDANKFVFINENNVEAYVGDGFVKQSGSGYEVVSLVSYETTTEYTAVYSLASIACNNVMANGMFSLTPIEGIDSEAFFNFIVVGENLKYDQAALQADVEKYGIFTYEDLDEYMTREEFDAFAASNGCYLKIAVEKGAITMEQLLAMLAPTDMVPKS